MQQVQKRFAGIFPECYEIRFSSNKLKKATLHADLNEALVQIEQKTRAGVAPQVGLKEKI